MGMTFIADLMSCQKNFKNSKEAKDLAMSVVNFAGMTSIGEVAATVTDGINSGETVIIVVVPLKESHLAIHTWPELKYVMVDFSTCGDIQKGREAFNDLCKWFEPKKVSYKEIVRENLL